MLADAENPTRDGADVYLTPAVVASLLTGGLAHAACRFCGETQHLKLCEGFTEGWAHDADGSLKRDASGEPVSVSFDFIECEICDAMAPVEVWNRARGATPEERAAVIAGWAEYDDEGRWIGGAK